MKDTGSTPGAFCVRRGSAADARGVARVHNGVVAERRFTALDHPITTASEAEWLAGFGTRAALHVAEVAGEIVGFQTLEPFQPFLRSMDHVATAGTQIAAGQRGRGVGRALWAATRAFGLETGYGKVIVQIRSGNEGAIAFYRSLDFEEIGVARRQVFIDGVYEDEAFLECFLTDARERPAPPRRRP